MRKIKLFGRSIPIMALAMLAMATIGSAMLLNYYGVIQTTVTISQSILLDGKTCTGPNGGGCTVNDAITELAPGGERFCFKHKLTNDMSVSGTVSFDTVPTEEEGITTTIYTLPVKTTLVLENKDPTTWNVIANDNIQATLTFDTVGNDGIFNYELDAEGLTPEKEYAIIYYGDQDPRFNLWGGDNPGAVIDTFTTDWSGNAIKSGSSEINMNLPNIPDWNINPSPDYCDNHNAYDDYEHCKGAKIWIVPTADLTGSNSLPLTVWKPTTYLFETDLITYFDCDLGVEDFLVDMVDKTEVEGSLIITSYEYRDFLICYRFAENILAKTYTITTNIVPVV